MKRKHDEKLAQKQKDEAKTLFAAESKEKVEA
jgi:hypothetical protein